MNDFKDIEYDTLSNQYINELFKYFNQCFIFFEYENFITDNIVESRTLKKNTKHILNFEDEEIKILMDEMSCQKSKDIFKVGLFTGMRISEIANLKNKNIDFKDKIITITDSKTKSGIRKIPIHNQILSIFKNYITDNSDSLVFDSSVNQLTKLMDRRIKKVINITGKSFHSTRKNFTQKLYELEQKDKIKENTIKRLLGHSNKDNFSFEVYNLNKIDIDILKESINLIEYKYFLNVDMKDNNIILSF